MSLLADAILQWCSSRGERPEELAAQARVGPAIVRKLIAGQIGPDATQASSLRQRAGWARSVVRLARYFQFDPAESLRSVGLDSFTARVSGAPPAGASATSLLARLVRQIGPPLTSAVSPVQTIHTVCDFLRNITGCDCLTAYAWNRRLNRVVAVVSEGLYVSEVDYSSCGPGDLLHRLLFTSPTGAVVYEPPPERTAHDADVTFASRERVVAWYALTLRWGTAPVCIFINFREGTAVPQHDGLDQVAMYLSGWVGRVAQGDNFDDDALDEQALSHLLRSRRGAVAFADELARSRTRPSATGREPMVQDGPLLATQDVEALESAIHKALEGAGGRTLGVTAHPAAGPPGRQYLVCRDADRGAAQPPGPVAIDGLALPDRFVRTGIGPQAAAWATTLAVSDLNAVVHERGNPVTWRQFHREWNPRHARDAHSVLAVPIRADSRVLGVVEIAYLDRKMAGALDSILVEAICEAFAQAKLVDLLAEAVPPAVRRCVEQMMSGLEADPGSLLSPDTFLGHLCEAIRRDAVADCDLAYVYLYEAELNRFMPYATTLSDELRQRFFEHVCGTVGGGEPREPTPSERKLIDLAVNDWLPRDVMDRTWMTFRRGVPSWVTDVASEVASGTRLSGFTRTFLSRLLAIPLSAHGATAPSGVLWCKWRKRAQDGSDRTGADAKLASVIDRWTPAIRVAAAFHTLGMLLRAVRPQAAISAP